MEENNKMRNIINQDSLIVVGMILIVIVICTLTTYAYVTWQGRDTSGGLTTTIGDIATITFDDGINLSGTNLTPVLNYEDGISLSFRVNKKIDTEAYMKLLLVINNIDEELKSESLKYILLASDNEANYEKISDGNFSHLSDNELEIIDDYKIDKQLTFYKLYVYIDGKENNNNMQNKSIDATLSVGANKEKKQDSYTSYTKTSEPITSDTNIESE